jgi:hypothetical protein
MKTFQRLDKGRGVARNGPQAPNLKADSMRRDESLFVRSGLCQRQRLDRGDQPVKRSNDKGAVHWDF